MQSVKKQRGLSFISWLIIFIMVGFFIMVGLKITPVYLDHFSIQAALKSVTEEPFVSRKPVKEIRNMIMNRLNINNIHHVTTDHISIKRSGGITRIEIVYEERRHIAYNIAVVMSFEESAELTPN
jgi:hypothetical protein